MASPPRAIARRNSNANKQSLPNIEISRRSDQDQPVTTATITAPSRNRLNTGDLKRKKSQPEPSHHTTEPLENVPKFSQRSSSSETRPEEVEDSFSMREPKMQRMEDVSSTLPIFAETPTQLDQNSSSGLAGDLHTGLTQQYNELNFDIEPNPPNLVPFLREFSTPKINSTDGISAIHEIFGAPNEDAQQPPEEDFELPEFSSSQTRLCDYKRVCDLGVGGSSQVYKAYVEGGEYEFIAIKRFENPQENDPEDVKRKRMDDRSQAVNEIEMLKLLDGHENVIKMGRYEAEKEHTYVELELMDTSLHDYMNQTPQSEFKQRLINSNKYDPTKIEQAKSYGVDLHQIGYWAACALQALEHFHENDYCHGDVKSGNLLLKYSPQIVKLADLGLTRSIRICPNGDFKRFYDLVGTPSNYAPEMWMTESLKNQIGNKSNGRKSSSQFFDKEDIRENLERFGKDLEDYIGYGLPVDIWALGCVLVHLATGNQLYYKGDSEEFMYNECMEFKLHNCEYSYKKAIEMMPSYLEDDPFYDKFTEFLRGCLTHSPLDRPTASELLEYDFLKPEYDEEPPSPT